MWSDDGNQVIGLALAGFGLAACAYLVYGAQLLRSGLLARPAERPALALALAVAASIGWSICGAADLLSIKTLAWHLGVACDQLRYAAWSLFLLSLLHKGGRPAALRLAVPAALLAAGLVADATLSATVSAGGWLRALAAVQLGWAIYGLVLVEQMFRNLDESARWSAKPLCLGLGCIFVFDLYLFAQAVMFGGLDTDVLNARALAHAVAVPLLLASARRSSHWLSRVRVSKATVFYSASLLLVGLYLLVVAGAGYYVRWFGGRWGGALQVALMTAALLALLVVTMSGSQRARVRVFLAKHFFSYHYDYRVEWLRFTAQLSARGAPDEVGLQVVRGLADLVECPAGSLWFRAAPDAPYLQVAAWNMPRVAAAEPPGTPFTYLLHEREWIVDFTAGDAAGPPPSWLGDAGALWLAIPLLVGDDMPGFVLLAPPRTPMTLNWEVRDLLKTAARQAAGYLALVHATEALMETRKFDAFNRMSAFVVHDLKNIITQQSLMLKNAERHRDNPEFQQDMLMTVENSLGKMRQLMLQLREGERPEGVSAGVELAPILQRLQLAASRRGREVTLEVADRVAGRGHEQRLERVIDHVVQNALDATPASGTVWIRLRRAAGSACVVVGDTGVGMTPEFIRTRLFKPFNSTKIHGMGIGTYESLQYLNELGGSIDVQSEVGRGTVITLSMPLFEQAADTALMPTADVER